MKKKPILKRILIIVGSIVLAAALAFLISYGYIRINTPKEYLIETPNRFETQQHLECAGYSSAYVLRSLGEEDAKGLELYEEIKDKNEDGTVNPGPVIKLLKSHNRSAKMLPGNELLLKYYISRGVPVIVLCREKPGSKYLHYLPVVGYDEESFYCADSLGYLAPERNEHYNRIVVNDSFMEMWDIGYPVKNFMIVAK